MKMPSVPSLFHRPWLVLLLTASLAGGCALQAQRPAITKAGATGTGSPPGRPAPAPAVPAQSIYDQAKAALVAQDFAHAAMLYRKLLATTPDDPQALAAEIELAYAYYRMGDSDSAYATAGRFIRRHPDDPRLDYLFYLRGLCNYGLARQEQQRSPEALSPHARLALADFEQLRGRFPDSRYLEDAKKRMIELQSMLIAQRLALAQRLLSSGSYAAAGLHAKAIIDDETATQAIKDKASVLLKMSYERLGLVVSRRPPRRAPAPVAVKPHHEAWIMAQKASDFTLQIIGSTNEPALIGFIKRQELKGDLAIFRTERDGKPWYTLIMGRYPDRSEAEAVARQLLDHFPEIKPWVRSLAEIQRIISDQGPAPVTARPATTESEATTAGAGPDEGTTRPGKVDEARPTKIAPGRDGARP